MKCRMIPLVALAALLHAMSCGDDKGTGQQQPRGTWEVAIGGEGLDAGHDVLALSDGSFVIAGTTRSFGAGQGDAYLIRVDSFGVKSWDRRFGGDQTDFARSLVQSSDGGFVMCGQTFSFGAGGSDLYLVKTTAEGALIWERTHGGPVWDEGTCVAATSDGGYVVAGLTGTYPRVEIYTVKVDGEGEFNWDWKSEAEAISSASAVLPDPDGGYVVAGWRLVPPGGSVDFFLTRLDGSGESVSYRSYDGPGDDYCNDLLHTADNGFLLVGWTDPLDTVGSDVYILKVNSEGNVDWETTYGGVGNSGANAVVAAPDGGYLVVGWRESTVTGGTDAYLMKISIDGSKLWERTYGGTDDDQAVAVAVTADGGYIIAGSTKSMGAGETDVYLIRVNANGEF